MPARTNDFQRLVRQVQQVFAPAGAKVTESAMIPDALGNLREIDVVLEGDFGEFRMKIAVEAKDHKRAIDKTIIEQLATKYRQGDGIQVNQVVVVSANGFTRSARDFAKRSGIKLFTLRETRQVDWKGMTPLIKSDLNFGMPPHLHEVRVEPIIPNTNRASLFPMHFYCTCCGRDKGFFGDYVNKWVTESVLKDSQTQQKVREYLTKSPNGNAMLTVTADVKNCKFVIEGKAVPFEKIVAEIHFASTPLEIKNYVRTGEDGHEQLLQRAVGIFGHKQVELLIPAVENGKLPDKIVLNISDADIQNTCKH
jgi:hypothetical protein